VGVANYHQAKALNGKEKELSSIKSSTLILLNLSHTELPN